MRIHSEEKIKKLKALRRKGYSIHQLMDEFSMPKTTIWHHIHDIKLSGKHIKYLRARQGGSMERKKKNWEIARGESRMLLDSPHREKLVILAMLYWAEGNKNRCEFINSDGVMIELYLEVIRKILNIPEERISPTMRTFTGMNRNECLEYWSKMTRIPKKKFIIRHNDGGTSGRTKYGMCRIIIRKGGNTLKLIHSLTDQICAESTKNKRPCSLKDKAAPS